MTTPAGGDPRWEGRRRAREAALQILYQAEVGHLTMADAARTHDAIGDEAIDLDETAREYAVALALRPGAAPRGADRSMPGRGVSQPRASVERLRLTLTPVPGDMNDPLAERVPA